MAGEELIVQYGFKYTRSCNCGGYYNLIYRKDDYEISWRPKRYIAKLKKANQTIFNWLPLIEADAKFKEIFPA